MEDGQRDHELIEWREVRHRANLGNIRQQRGVGVHDAFRLAFGPRSEQHDSRIVGSPLDAHHARQQPVDEDPHLVGESDRRLQILEILNPHVAEIISKMQKAGLLQKHTRRDDGTDAGRLARGAQPVGT